MIAERLKYIFPFFWQSIRNSYTQVFFNKNKWLGFILIAVSFFDLNAGLSGLLAVLIANSAAFLIGLNRQHIVNGFYGFNPLLVGLGYGIAFQPGLSFFIILLFITLLTLFASVLLAGILSKYGLPYLSLPFLIGLWIVMLSARQIDQLSLSEGGIYFLNELYLLGGMPLLRLYDWFEALHWHESFKLYFKSLGAIFFQYHLFAGLLIAAGLLIWSRLAFLLSVVGFAAAYFFYQAVGADLNELSYNYIGFNFILTAIAIGGFFVIPSWHSMLWVIVSIPLLAFMQIATNVVLNPMQLGVLSLPFNLVVISFLFVFRLRERFTDKPALVYLQQFQPEKNLYSALVNRSRLAHLQRIPMKLPFWGFWKVTQGISGKHTHKDAWRYAWDFEITDKEGKTYKNEGNALADYYCYGKPVLAAAGGTVTEIINNLNDNDIGDMNLQHNWGNSIVISHAEGLFSQLSHLQKGSILVQKGQYVQQGTQVASCGNSGRSPFPHLHFQFQTASETGSHTLNYPFAAYLSKEAEIRFHSSDQPRQDEVVGNNVLEEQLDKALHFIPGQEIRFEIASGDEKEIITWKIETDIFNQSYLYCSKTQSKAWFSRIPDMFYFTHFEGNRKSVLYDVYLGAYQIITGHVPGLKIDERLTLSEFPMLPLKILQDFLSPFYRFLEIRFKASYLKSSNSITATEIKIQSEVQFFALGKQLQKRTYLLCFSEGEINQFVIEKDTHTLTLNRV
ncbi:MAG: urea transporter [Bacteroidetes bacterium]|nr:urea transporter [Bacteroidota bacterium]